MQFSLCSNVFFKWRTMQLCFSGLQLRTADLMSPNLGVCFISCWGGKERESKKIQPDKWNCLHDIFFPLPICYWRKMGVILFNLVLTERKWRGEFHQDIVRGHHPFFYIDEQSFFQPAKACHSESINSVTRGSFGHSLARDKGIYFYYGSPSLPCLIRL